MFDAINYLLGIKVEDEEEYNDNLLELTDWLKIEYPHRTLDEILLAYRMLVRGDFNLEAYPILNPNQMGRVLKAYDAKRANVYREMHGYLNKVLGEAPNVPDQEESDEMFYTVLHQACDTYRKVQRYEDFGNYLYDELAKRRLLNIPTEEKRLLMEQAKQELVSQKQAQIITSFGSRRRENEKAKASLECEDEYGLPLIVARAKRKAVNRFIGSVAEDLKTFLEHHNYPTPNETKA